MTSRSTLLLACLVTLVAPTLPACQGASTPAAVATSGQGNAADGSVPAAGYGRIVGSVSADQLVASGAGNLVASGAGNLVASGAGNFHTSATRSLLAAVGATATIKVSSAIDTKEVASRADGSFAVDVKAGADYTLEATVPDGKGGTLKLVKQAVNVPLSQDPKIVDVASLVTRRTGSIQGVAALPKGDSHSIEGADVFIGGTSVVGKCGAKGNFTLAEVAEGSWDVVIQKPGFVRQIVKGVSVKAGRPTLLEAAVALQPDSQPSGVKGLVRDGSGKAIIGATVTLYPKAGVTASGLTSFTAVSDEQGAYEVDGLTAGDYQLQVYRPFYGVASRRDVTVVAGAVADAGTTSLESTVVYFGKIKGLVVDDQGAAIASAVVQTEPQVTDQQFTDATGAFTLDRVLAGQYTLSVSAGGYQAVLLPVRVENRQDFVLTLGGKLVLSTQATAAAPLLRFGADLGLATPAPLLF